MLENGEFGKKKKNDKHVLEEIASNIEWILALFFLDVRPKTPQWRKRTCYVLVGTCTAFCVYYCFNLVCLLLEHKQRMTTASLLDALDHAIFCIHGMTSAMFLLHIQRKDSMRTFMAKLMKSNEGHGCIAHSATLRKTCKFFNFLCLFSVLFGILLVTAYVLGYYHDNLDSRILTAFYYRELYVLYLFSIAYFFIAWNISVQIYVLGARSALCTLKEIHREIESIGGTSEDEVVARISDCASRHAAFSSAVQCLNKTVKEYAFINLAMSIPGTLFTLFEAIVARTSTSSDVLTIAPGFIFSFYGFLCIAYFPAELHENAMNTRQVFCNNARIWTPFREKVYSKALIFLSYIDHSELGISAWGFAVLSRPAILTTISVMVTLLALLLQVRGCHRSSF